MGCKVTYIPLGELAKFESGGTPSKKEESYWNGAIPWISAKTLVGDAVWKSDLCITKQGLDAGSKLAPKGSLLLLTRGSGLFKRIPLAIAEKDVAYNQDIKCIEATAKGISNRYLFYALKVLEPAISAMLETTGIGAGKLATDRLKALQIPVLDETARSKVTYLADCINGKLSLNTKLNGYLDEYIDATLRNMLNQQEGAEVSLGDYLYIKGRIGWKGLKKSEYLSDSDYRIINGESLTMSGIDWNKAGYISKERYDESPEIMLEVGDILLSKDGTIGKIGYVDELERPTTVASGIFVIRNLRKDVLSTHFVYYLLKSRLFKAFIASRTEGSVIPHLYQKDFVEFLFPLPPIDVMKKFDKLTGPMFQQTIVNAHENKRLAELRDALLPKLMSGEIDVSKIDLTQLNSHLA